mmetsp:Transcript_1066/g.3967  ORF Transcript_1066/g.3967 Transcript_1066/m.3967 type:complete len:224 (-) Transcript_1066:1808-2479(-)
MFLERWQNDGHSLVKGGPTFHPTFHSPRARRLTKSNSIRRRAIQTTHRELALVVERRVKTEPTRPSQASTFFFDFFALTFSPAPPFATALLAFSAFSAFLAAFSAFSAFSAARLSSARSRALIDILLSLATSARRPAFTPNSLVSAKCLRSAATTGADGSRLFSDAIILASLSPGVSTFASPPRLVWRSSTDVLALLPTFGGGMAGLKSPRVVEWSLASSAGA